jgi:hypothetical protein
LIDGKDIATLHLKTLRSQIGLVSQVRASPLPFFSFVSFPIPVCFIGALCTTVEHNCSCFIIQQLDRMGLST